MLQQISKLEVQITIYETHTYLPIIKQNKYILLISGECEI